MLRAIASNPPPVLLAGLISPTSASRRWNAINRSVTRSLIWLLIKPKNSRLIPFSMCEKLGSFAWLLGFRDLIWLRSSEALEILFKRLFGFIRADLLLQLSGTLLPSLMPI